MKTSAPTLAARLALARETRQLSQTALAAKAGVSQGTIGNAESGVRKLPRELPAIAAALDVRYRWLRYGEEPMSDAISEPSNVSPGPEIKGTVPLISWVQAGEWSEVDDPFPPGEGYETITTTGPIHEHTFALRVEGDSMMPMFAPGMILIVEPDMEPHPGDFVIAKNGDAATFKQYVKDGGDYYLKPLNPQYPMKPLGSSRIIGVIRDAVLRLR